MSSILSYLRKEGGCIGGRMIYFAARGAASLANSKLFAWRKRRELSDRTKRLMKPFFPKLNLNNVRFCINSTLPANWFEPRSKVKAMTFGYRIYFKEGGIQKSRAKLQLLMHELVHVDQVRRHGNSEWNFACAYGKGFLKGKSYLNNPMEIEAREFVKNHPLPSLSTSRPPYTVRRVYPPRLTSDEYREQKRRGTLGQDYRDRRQLK